MGFYILQRVNPLHSPVLLTAYAEYSPVEDDSALSELIASYLQRNDFHVRVIARGDHVLEEFRRQKPDLVVLDLMLPGLDGLQVCRLLRQESQSLPILMLTARDDSHDQVLGLEMGADDYVTKPCEPRVLLARVRTLLRRSTVNEPRLDSDLIRVGACASTWPSVSSPGAATRWSCPAASTTCWWCWPAMPARCSAATAFSSNCAASSSTAPTARWTWPSQAAAQVR